MKPFLILQLRPNDKASDNEFEAFLKFGGLSKNEVRRVRMEKSGIPEINLNDYSGIIVGGGPFNISDGFTKKSEAQKKLEKDLESLLDEIIKMDFPYLGACYGLGALAKHQGVKVSKEKYSEDVGGITIKLTQEGVKDPILKGLPKEFRAFGGHKEACQAVPKGAVLLGSSAACPVQIIRVKENIYGIQFHTELDTEGIILRIKIYKDAGYFPPEDAGELINLAKKESVTVPEKILRRFIERYKEH